MLKRSAEEEMSSSPMYPRLETLDENYVCYLNEINIPSLELSNMNTDCTTSSDVSSDKELSASEPIMYFTTSMLISWGDDTTSFPDDCCELTSVKDYLNTFFQDYNSKNLECYSVLPTNFSVLNKPLQDSTTYPVFRSLFSSYSRLVCLPLLQLADLLSTCPYLSCTLCLTLFPLYC